MKLKDYRSAQQDFETSYQALPQLALPRGSGKTAEMKKDWNSAITKYSRALP